jgi:predicted P-loop ATPase
MMISTGKSRHDTAWKAENITWQELTERLRTPCKTPETLSEYMRMPAAEKADRKDVGGFVGGRLRGSRRKSEDVLSRCLITLDADNAYPGLWDDVTVMLPWQMCAYSTHSHRPDKPRLRFVLPTTRDVTPDEYPAIARRLAEMIGIETMDPTTYQPARLMYWPSVSRDGEYLFYEQDGDAVNPDDILSTYNNWRNAAEWPTSSSETEIRVSAAKRQGDPTEKPGIVGRFCRAYDVPAAIETFLSDKYRPEPSGRYTWIEGTTASGAVLYDDGAFLYSNHSTDPAQGQLCNAFDLVRIHKFADRDTDPTVDITKRPSYLAMCDFAASLPELKEAMVKEVNEDFADMRDQSEWVHQLECNKKTGLIEPTIENLRLILTYDDAFRGKLALNAFSGRLVWRSAPPWNPFERVQFTNGRPFTDADAANLRNYFQKHWKVNAPKALEDALTSVSDANAFNPVREYLDSLSWDGTERLDTLLVRYMKAQDTPFTRAATRKWFTGAVKRIYEPGCKFDSMLVLIGEQGVGKSRLPLIMSKGWFTDSLPSMSGDKSSFEALSGKWIVEVAELAAAKKSEQESIKNFVSKQTDSYRQAYAHYTQDYPRQCVFFGTTNDPEPLHDPTGARRFWTIEVEGFERGVLTGLEEERDQLWAEAKQRYHDGETLWLDDDAVNAEAVALQDHYTVHDEMEASILEYLDRRLPGNWYNLSVEDRRDFIHGDALSSYADAELTLVRDVICVQEIRVELCGQDPTRGGSDEKLSRRIGAILNRLPGWKRAVGQRRIPGHGKQRYYTRKP